MKAAQSTRPVGIRIFGALVLGASLLTVAGCMAVGNAETVSPSLHRSSGSMFASLAGTTTSDMTEAFPSSTTNAVVDSTAVVSPEGQTRGDLSQLAPNALWTVKIGEQLDGLRLSSFYGSEEISPLQVGNVMVVSLNSSKLNTAGTAAFSMADGSLLWQDRSLECQRVDLGGALPCRQNSGVWAPLNPASGTFGDAIDPGFAPEVVGFQDGVLYSARTTGTGDLQIAAGSLHSPKELWETRVPRSEDAVVPKKKAEITVGDTVRVRLGAAEIELTKAGTPLTPNAQLYQGQEHQPFRTEGDTTVVSTNADELIGYRAGHQVWSIPARVVDKHSVSDGQFLTFVQGKQAGNVLTTVSLMDGAVVDEHAVVAESANPKAVQSAASGLFHVDKQFSTISFYPAPPRV